MTSQLLRSELRLCVNFFLREYFLGCCHPVPIRMPAISRFCQGVEMHIEVFAQIILTRLKFGKVLPFFDGSFSRRLQVGLRPAEGHYK